MWNSPDIVKYIESIISYIHLSSYFENTTWDVYIIMFYMLLALVFLIIIDIAYVSYSTSRTKFTFSWPLYALRTLILLFTTVLFLPILNYFFSVLSCITNNQNKIAHIYFNEIVCWENIHILHSIFAILIAIIFISIAIIVGLTYFDCRTSSADPGARSLIILNTPFLLTKIRR